MVHSNWMVMNHSLKLSPGLNKWLVSWSKQSECKFLCVAFCYFLLTRAVLFPRVGDLCLRVTVVSWCRVWRGLATALMGRWGMRCYVSGEDQAAVIMLLPELRGASSAHYCVTLPLWGIISWWMGKCWIVRRAGGKIVSTVNLSSLQCNDCGCFLSFYIAKPQTVLINRK